MSRYERGFAALEALYDRLDAELSRLGAHCDGCGECCCFDRVDHLLYASALERDYLVHADAIPDPDPACREPVTELVAAGARCPYQVASRCHARRGRVLGCRLHFCVDPAPERIMGEAGEQWHAELKNLHAELGLDWRYGPLLPLYTYAL